MKRSSVARDPWARVFHSDGNRDVLVTGPKDADRVTVGRFPTMGRMNGVPPTPGVSYIVFILLGLGAVFAYRFDFIGVNESSGGKLGIRPPPPGVFCKECAGHRK